MDDDIARLYGLVDVITPMAIRVAATLRLADRIAAGALLQMSSPPIRMRWPGCCATRSEHEYSLIDCTVR